MNKNQNWYEKDDHVIITNLYFIQTNHKIANEKINT